jgi:glycine cleavage system H protein
MSTPTSVVEVGSYRFPIGLYYTDRHLWVRKEPNGALTVGVDDLGQKLTGRISVMTLMEEGQRVTGGKVFGVMESMKWVERLRSPVTGTVAEVNNQLMSRPQVVNQDPYGAGWMIKVDPAAEAEEELSKLVHGDAIKGWAATEVEDKAKLIPK